MHCVELCEKKNVFNMADEVRQRFIIHTCDVFLALLHAKSYPAAKTTLIS